MKITMIDPFETWALWFAWHPVCVGNVIVWGERVERRLRMYAYDPVWEYRFPTEVNND